MAEPKWPAAVDIVHRVMRARGIDPTKKGAVPALARETGLSTSYLYRWNAGQHRPMGDKVVELLERAGLIDWTADQDGSHDGAGDATKNETAVRRATRRHAVLSGRLESLEAKVDLFGQRATESLEGIEGRLAEIKRLLQPPDASSSRSR